MKRAILLSTTIALSAVSTSSSHSNVPVQTGNSIIGAWELVSAQYNGQARGRDSREVKIISAAHYIWLDYNRKTMKTIAGGTGSYTLNGDSYTEHIDLLDAQGAEGWNGKSATFKIKVDANELTQTGSMGGGSLKEIWKRLDSYSSGAAASPIISTAPAASR